MVSIARYPIYIPTKGRWGRCPTAKLLERENIPFRLVVEPQEAENYAPIGELLVLPISDGGIAASRTWIRKHALESGSEWHWQMDDDLKGFYRYDSGKKVPCPIAEAIDRAEALIRTERFTDEIPGVAIIGFSLSAFLALGTPSNQINHGCYSFVLVRNDVPFTWRDGVGYEDVDFCLQAIALGWRTVTLGFYAFHSAPLGKSSGGNRDTMYADGGMRACRALERKWPGVVSIARYARGPGAKIAWNKLVR